MLSPLHKSELTTIITPTKVIPFKHKNKLFLTRNQSFLPHNKIFSYKKKESFPESEENTKISHHQSFRKIPPLKSPNRIFEYKMNNPIHLKKTCSSTNLIKPNKLYSPITTKNPTKCPLLSYSPCEKSTTRLNNCAPLSTLYEKYLNVQMNNSTNSIKNKYTNKKSSKYILDQLYKNSFEYSNQKNLIKKNNEIVQRNDFDLKIYQNMLWRH